ncbi:MAG: shikimate dehydrogenase [Pseudomonadota bacterium]|nr:shikimate dehydrogenase [Pseudomonadota bacterium]
MTSVPSSSSRATSAYAEVIGDPIEHSRSPLIHQYWLDALGIAATYRRQLVREDELASHVAAARADPQWRGSNVTMPLKRAALDLAEGATDRAVTAGAANLLLMREGKLFAANADVGAIATLVDRERKSGRRVGTVTVFGTGGAARGALVALKLLGIDQVRIQARDMVAATKLAVEFGLAVGPRQLTERVDSDVLINATPLGMAGYECLNCDLSLLPPEGLVFDMVSNPADTPLILAAKARGLSTVTGLDMLVEQAASSFKLMFGVDPPRDRDAGLWERLRP